jgi:tight adherence protein B
MGAGSLMSRALLTLALVFVTVLPAAADDGLSIREIDAAAAPKVDVTVSLAEPAAVTPENLEVFEDGVAVKSFTVSQLDVSGRPVDVVLTLDTSGSMLGEPMAAAVDAARQFVESVPLQVRMGLVTFADRPVVAQRLTDDRGAVLAALDDVVAAGETALYDGVTEAASLFSGEAQRNIILLSDGGDTASAGSLDQAVAAAVDAGSTVFSVGWRTSETDITALRTLARESGGRYASAGSADVAAIYAGLAAELSNQYVVSYTTDRQQGGEVSITVSGEWGTDTTVVLFPEVEVVPEPAPARSGPEPYRPPLLRGGWGLALSVGLVFASALALFLMAFGVPLRRRRRRMLERRMGAGGSGQAADQEETGGAAAWIPEPFAAAGQMVAESAGFADRLDRRLEQSGLSLRPGEFVVGTFLAAVVGGVVAGLLFQSALWGLTGAVVAALIPISALAMAARRRLNGLQAQVVDVLMIIASSLRAGHSFLQALDMVSKEIAEPAAGEFSRAVSEIRLGRSVDEALSALGDRMASEDFEWAMMAVNIQREVGGNLAEVLDTVAETLRDRETVRRQVRVLASEGKLSARILTVLPFAIILFIAKTNGGFLDPLFGSFIGRVLLAGGAILMLVGIIIMRRMVRVDV